MIDYKSQQTSISLGIGNSTRQNIIQINPNDIELQYARITNDKFLYPRQRMQIESKLDIPNDLINITSIKQNIKMANRWIQSAQNPNDFGLPTDDVGSESCTWASSGLLWSSWIVSGETPNWWIKCLRWVLSQINADNGIPIVLRNDSSITDATAYTLMCASVAGDQFQNTASILCDWILDMQLNGGWKWSEHAKNYNFISSCLALLSIKLYFNITGEKPERIGKAINHGIEFLVRNRNIDSGWGGYPNDISRPANTGYVIYVLSILGQGIMANDSLEYLRDKYRDIIGWNNSTDRPASHNVTRLGVPYSLIGLSSLKPSIERDELLKLGFDILLGGFKDGVYEIPDSVARSWPTRDFMFACSTMVTD